MSNDLIFRQIRMKILAKHNIQHNKQKMTKPNDKINIRKKHHHLK